MGLSNDERGWIMTCISGVACVLGASIICADIIIRQFPGKKNFRIQDSDVFLSSSLSLSFGVMLFSSLYSMLPSAKKSLQDGNFSPKAAAWILVGCFLGGALVIQLVSRILHRFMPSHAVDCEHTHDEENGGKEGPENDHDHDDEDHHSHNHSHSHNHNHSHEQQPMQEQRQSRARHSHRPQLGSGSKSTPGHAGSKQQSLLAPSSDHDHLAVSSPTKARRPSLKARISQTFSNMTTQKPSCNDDGPCYGFTEPCGQDCFKKIQARSSVRTPSSRSLGRSATRSKPSIHESMTESTPLLQVRDTETDGNRDYIPEEDEDDLSSPTIVEGGSKQLSSAERNRSESPSSHGDEADGHHHHHVPTNAFLSIGLQTSIAIALHKLPEGFITYATNHANPELGFAVFLALFIHNITEGFALALPLYLAINSRPKAMFWSFILGGCSQPLGAGVAALWFKLAGSGNMAPGEGVYGVMFAITAGIMASVALQLFSESLDLTHNRGLCMVFAFVGMGILGISSALTAS